MDVDGKSKAELQKMQDDMIKSLEVINNALATGMYDRTDSSI
jgi:hypothetical protein